MNFEFSTAHRIIFKQGASQQIPALAAQFGERPCLVIGSNPNRTAWLRDAFNEPPLIIQMATEPDTDSMVKAVAAVRDGNCDVVVALGGGSVLDTGKVLSALATNKKDIFEYLEVVGRGTPLTNPPLPMIAVPTTAGTGSEVTANGVLLSNKHGVKVSLRSSEMIPNISVIDPELTLSMPHSVTASTGMDALTQLIEAYVSNKSNPITDALCREGIMRAATSLHAACEDGKNIAAREDMCIASLFSGIALANAKLGAVHGFAAPMGGEFKAPHGMICASLLPHVIRANIQALRLRTPESSTLFRYTEIAVMLTGDVTNEAEDGADWIQNLCSELGIPSLAGLGVPSKDFDKLAQKAAQTSSMKGNPIELTHEELIKILESAA
ncbi:iron-containing alcohol dehydrogenase [Pseudodesulfovibrio piezophilus]|uniref:Fe-containing alcohol dehydrogenase n=1 Tax=Pseudodesulfovibrio piezophilus (strain DSM 21447 / JCM 15486 / C1TLV30) TaxID=1322246 RepID=M1WQV2_PSEP2|nr:iron-containing alcohol dehydrogenase [Pseudodesulfovibrio piezophilus]CCH47887.1 Fe-containing alcohol dehydrogenase [Pseudodesulfovibrio piezophilus C1TLV30]